MKLFYTLVLFFITLLLHAQDSLSLQLKWWHQFQFAGYYAAQTQGYYAEEGLAVKIAPGGPGISPVNEVTTGKAQFGISGSDLLLQFTSGKPVVALGALFQHSPYTFMTLKDRNLAEPSDLAGKTVMVCDDQGWAEMRAALLLEGIDPNSIHVIKHSWNNNDLISGKADAISAYSTVEPWQMANAGYQTNLIKPVSYGVDFYGDILFTSHEMMNTQPETVEKFRRASFRGWEYAMTHVEEMVNYILGLPGVKEHRITREQLMREAAEMSKIILPELIEIGHMNDGRWQHILTTYQMLGMAQPRASLDGFVYDQYAEQRSGYIRKLMYVILALFLLTALFIFSYFTMKRMIRRTRERLEMETTSLLATQMKLNNTEEYLDMAVNGATLGMWTLDVTNDAFTFNSIWKSMLGYDSEEIKIGKDMMLDLIHPADRDRIADFMNAHIDGKTESFEGTMRMKTKSGAWKWIHTKANAQEWDKNGVATRLTGIHLDIDELKKKEIELIHMSEELLRNNNDLRQFSHVISHNMRAPIATMAGLLQVIEPETRAADKSDIIGKIEVCTHMLMSTMDDLNHILTAKNINGKTGETILLRERVRALIELLEDKFVPLGAFVKIDPGMKESVLFPADVFDEVILNLLGNAIKFRNQGRLLRVDISAREDEDFIHLYIRDNGMGLDMKTHGSKLFGIYQRFHPRTEGKGIGLYLCKIQLESLGGKINMDSAVDTGSTFTVSFPKEPFCTVPDLLVTELNRQ